MLRLPYSISNFATLVRDGYHYVDRTPFLAQLEQLNERYLFYLRPRRFGKSLFISLLQHYYGLEFQDRFVELFGNYTIGQTPTPLANHFYVLKFDFSRINTRTAQSTFEGFLANVKYGVSDFLATYHSIFAVEDESYILSAEIPSDVLNRLFERFKHSQTTSNTAGQIYLLIDEYDHFANELVAFRLDDFKQSVSRNVYVRKFFESIKTATGEGVVDRLFVTGVSPLTLDSLTSGFNIGKNLSLDLQFHGMMGFSEAEVAEILTGIDVEPSAQPTILADMRQWYNGYLFHPRSETRLYNPDMVLYFASEYSRNGVYPDELLDINVASDYGKVRNLFSINNQENEHFAVLEELLTLGSVAARLTRQFSFEKVFTRDDLISLLFYMGIVTIKEAQLSRYIFETPNFVITQLYYEYFNQLLLQRAGLNADTIRIYDRVLKLAQENQIQPVIEAVESILRQLSNRDAVGFDEKYVKAILASLFYTTQIYTIHSEYESERGYIDLLLTRRPPIEPNYQFAFELKYLKQNEATRLDEVKQAGLNQLQTYLRQEKLQSMSDLRAWLLVFVGTEAKVIEQVTR